MISVLQPLSGKFPEGILTELQGQTLMYMKTDGMTERDAAKRATVERLRIASAERIFVIDDLKSQGIVFESSSDAIPTVKRSQFVPPEQYSDYTKDPCPVCGEPGVMGTRGFTSDRGCDNGHWWYWLDGERHIGIAQGKYRIILESATDTNEPWRIVKADFAALQDKLLPPWEPGIGFYGGYEFVMPDKSTRSYKGPAYTKEEAIELFHRESVSMALQMGKPVPSEVLADYPEFNNHVLESTLTAEEIHDIAHQAATSHKNDLPEPTEGQAKAGNYKHAHLKLYGLDITIENPAGSKRSGIDPDGKPWECTIPAHYGFFKRTEGADGDHVDCYIGEHPESERVFIVDQMDLMTGCFDEHKTVLAALDEEEARNIYISGFSDGKGPDRIGAITEMNMDEFKTWLAEGETTQPVGRITVPQI